MHKRQKEAYYREKEPYYSLLPSDMSVLVGRFYAANMDIPEGERSKSEEERQR